MGVTYRPTYAISHPSKDGFRSSSVASQNFFLDRTIEDLLFFPNVTEHDPDNAVGVGAGDPELAELNSSEICALFMDTDADAHGISWPIPVDLATDSAIDFRVGWSNSEAAATGSCLWSVVYKAIVAGTTAFAVGATALDTLITNQADLAANVFQWTPWGSIAAGTAAITALVPGDDALNLSIAADLTTIADASLIRFQVRYYKWMQR